MPRSSLLAELQRLYRKASMADSDRRDVRRSALATSRRDLLLLAGAPVFVGLPSPRLRTVPRIAIVGGGIAGLTAGLTLLNGGYASSIYEASQRVGGRMQSDTHSWLNHQVSEHCGELIDSGHSTIRGLAHSYRIRLIDLLAAQPKGSTDTGFFLGDYYRAEQADRDFKPVYDALTRDQKAAGYPTTFDHHNDAAESLDNTSAYDWIEKNVPGGHGSAMGRLIDVAYDIEFGAPTRAQSALNIVYLLSDQSNAKDVALFGSSDERYHMRGGNERLPRAIAAEIEGRAPGTVRLGHSLTSIAKQGDGSYLLGVQSEDGATSVKADYVILAIPFSVLRKLDYARAGFDDRKKLAIEELGYGTNVKLQLQFNERVWNRGGRWGMSTGGTFTDLGYQNTWEVTRGQGGKTGILVNYMGSAGAEISGDPRDPNVVRGYAQRFLGQLETVFPGIGATWNGRATLDVPAGLPFLLGSYSYWKVGQYTRIAGAEKLPSGQCHFSGEHCSIDFQGYMEGGAREGIRAARDVLHAVRSSGRP